MFTLFALSFAFHGYVALRLLAALPDAWAWSLGAGLLASALLMPIGMMARRRFKPPAADRLTWAGMLSMGLFSSLLVATFLRDLGLLVLWLADIWLADLPWPALLDGSARAVPKRHWT